METSIGVDDITTAVRHARTLGLSSRRRQNWKKKWMKGFRNNEIRKKRKKDTERIETFWRKKRKRKRKSSLQDV